MQCQLKGIIIKLFISFTIQLGIADLFIFGFQGFQIVQTALILNPVTNFNKYIYVFFSQCLIFRSSHPDALLVKGALKICSKFTGEHLCQSVISITFQSLSLKKKLWRRRFPVNFTKSLRITYSPTNHL